MSTPVPFDVCGSLPTGVTVLEASAGTGKTYTLAALAARYVADGTPLDQVLLVTFTRMATGELRERVRDRFVTAERGLANALAGGHMSAHDDVVRFLADGTDDVVEERRRRLAAALADFDAATIATTHGFCQHALSGLGIAGDAEQDATFIENHSDLVAEVVDDLYVRKFAREGEGPFFDRAEALRIGRVAVDNLSAAIQPEASGDPVDATRARLAEAVRDEFEMRKRRLRILTYDDLLTRLRDRLADPERGGAACDRLRDRYSVALVDEFQDTDPVQWEIMQRAFGSGGGTLVLIGDPKQAIYAFRGADVYSYLEAARTAGTRATLGVNWRSDQGLIDAYDRLFSAASLGHSDIAYRTVRAVEANAEPRLLDAPRPTPLRVRVVDRDDDHVRLTRSRFVQVGSGREHVAQDLAGDVVELLSSNAEITTRDAEGVEVEREPVRPGHIAVLVHRNRDAAIVRDALDDVGVPAVINGAGSVFGAPITREWLVLLEALEGPSSSARVRAAALTTFLGWSAECVARAKESDWDDVHARLHRWAHVLRRRGGASLLETITCTEGLPGRILARTDGERDLTDLRHVGQLLHAEAVSERLGIAALVAWLRRRIAEAGADTNVEERSRRLESDAEAVQVLTIHRSKGLEFPVVYYPYLWDPVWIDDKAFPVFHDPAAGDGRTIDVGTRGSEFNQHGRRYREEQRGEELRLLYVALTRARHQAVVWWAGSHGSRDSALGRLLFASDERGDVAPYGRSTPSDDVVRAKFERLSTEAPGTIIVEATTGGSEARWAQDTEDAGALEARPFGRPIDSLWRRTSYTAITSGAHESGVASEPEETGITDEAPLDSGGGPEPEADEQGDESRLRAVPSILAGMPGGTKIGSFVHSTFEHVDFTVPDLDEELRRQIADQRTWSGIDLGDEDAFVAGLRGAIETPLGPRFGDVALRDVGAADRLDELDFELPLVGGDRPTTEVRVGAIASLMREYVPPGDVLAPYADLLVVPELSRSLRGFLTGSIDLVLRLDGSGAGRGERQSSEHRYVVVDYKTNRLGGGEADSLSAWHYRPAALVDAMMRAHYPLQALLYCVALHRFLRWRLPGYTPERNLAGVAYLFVRGMTGPDVPRVGGEPCGVFAWQPPPGLVSALSDLLDTGEMTS